MIRKRFYGEIQVAQPSESQRQDHAGHVLIDADGLVLRLLDEP